MNVFGSAIENFVPMMNVLPEPKYRQSNLTLTTKTHAQNRPRARSLPTRCNSLFKRRNDLSIPTELRMELLNERVKEHFTGVTFAFGNSRGGDRLVESRSPNGSDKRRGARINRHSENWEQRPGLGHRTIPETFVRFDFTYVSWYHSNPFRNPFKDVADADKYFSRALQD